MSTVRERPALDLGDDLDLSDFGATEQQASPVAEPRADEVEAVSAQAGFPSRSSRRRRRKVSPFQFPIGIKSREGMKDLFQDLGDLLDTHDHTTFEKAIEALIEKTGDRALLERFKRLTITR